jgi:hypothetical protein
MLEKDYQHYLIKKLESILPGCLVIKNDPTYVQGIPDLIILYKDSWAMLEVKTHADAPIRPNQNYYVDMLNGMSFSAFIFPENEEEVLDALQSAFGITRQARLFEPE